MKRILLIARREFAAYAKTVGFWLSLLAIPASFKEIRADFLRLLDNILADEQDQPARAEPI